MAPDKLYLVVEYDNHTDPEYQLFVDRDEAFDRAKDLALEYAESYKHDIETREAKDWVCYQGEERWYIVVEKVSVKYKLEIPVK